MQIMLNGQPLHTDAATLESLLKQQQIDIAVVACAIDGQFIPKSLYDGTLLIAGMRIEVLSPMQGG